MILWKALRADLKSENGNQTWEIGKWCEFDGRLSMCSKGFHCSPRVIDAMQYVPLEILAQVEVDGNHLEDKNKSCWRKMRMVKAWRWTKKDSVALAIFAAELTLANFEKGYPDDKRPRQAIEAAKKVLEADTEENRSAAELAAELAARSVARSAAESVARSAAWSAAWSAARSAESAARSAAGSEILDKCEMFIQRRIKKLEAV